MSKCEHIQSYVTWKATDGTLTDGGYGASLPGEIAFARWCADCGERLGMGPANDEPAEVQVEIRAAGITTGDVMIWISLPDTADECIGWDAWLNDRDLLGSLGGRAGREAGWLACAIAHHEERLDPDDVPIAAGAASYVGMTPREIREHFAESDRVEDELRVRFAEPGTGTADFRQPSQYEDKVIPVAGGPFRVAQVDHAGLVVETAEDFPEPEVRCVDMPRPSTEVVALVDIDSDREPTEAFSPVEGEPV